ncbi:MAG: flavin reductase [Gammaproteobacteria bacterium HGW-Gammaproteobacteria-10]|nr:MAG: flavin reductase [Gammaproteobacteria bacterium HGW-Gammaproteobacteria-3]PKM35434.1 MAG: flavin reductase [Gammaproteobacteria bacterium HGW-Gammaproteobacteria-10]
MTVEVNDFKQALQLWASGVTVVTTHTEQSGPLGMTATSFSSVSLEPPQILVCINTQTDTGNSIQQCRHFAVNILTAAQQAISNEFAGGASQQERFANVSWSQGVYNMPVLNDSLTSLECRVLQQIKAGTHWVIVGEVLDVITRSGEPLIYYRSDYRQLDRQKK